MKSKTDKFWLFVIVGATLVGLAIEGKQAMQPQGGIGQPMTIYTPYSAPDPFAQQPGYIYGGPPPPSCTAPSCNP
jgi:hypothetical protein